MSLLLEPSLVSRGRAAFVAAAAAAAAAEEEDSVNGGAGAKAGGDSSSVDSQALLRASLTSSEAKKREEKGGGYGDSPAVVNTALMLAGAVTEHCGRGVSLSLGDKGKGVTTDKPSVLGTCVHDKLPVAAYWMASR